MLAREIMTEDPVVCTPFDNVRAAARAMMENNCGWLPVVDDQQNRRLLGVITDRDIVCRILAGDMSIVGPRPALFNQDDLVALRTKNGVHVLTPGLTGWAQIHGRDELPIPVKVEFDEYYLKHRSFLLDLKIILKTVVKVARSEGVKH